MKYIYFAAAIVLISLGAGCENVSTPQSNQYSEDMQNKCFSWAEYDPEKKAWRWMSANAIEMGKGGFFPSRQEAIDNCLATFQALNK